MKRHIIPFSVPVIILSLIISPGKNPPVRAHHALVYDEEKKCILMTAGSTPVNGGESFTFYNDIWCFDGKAWNERAVSGSRRSGIQLVYHSKDKKIYSFGGYSGDSSMSDLRILENGQWKTIAWLPEMKTTESGFVYDASRDRLIVFGGSAAGRSVHADTWEWDGFSWTKFKGAGPEGRQAFAMVYDSKRKKTVLFGGMGPTPETIFNDTWEFDGVQWIKVNSAGAGARMSPGFCYDAQKGMMMIYGGASASGFIGDTWGWDGSVWKKLADTGPSARVMGYMAYDKERKKAILFGGRIGWPNDVNDTWEWDGTTWKEIKPD